MLQPVLWEAFGHVTYVPAAPAHTAHSIVRKIARTRCSVRSGLAVADPRPAHQRQAITEARQGDAMGGWRADRGTEARGVAWRGLAV